MFRLIFLSLSVTLLHAVSSMLDLAPGAIPLFGRSCFLWKDKTITLQLSVYIVNINLLRVLLDCGTICGLERHMWQKRQALHRKCDAARDFMLPHFKKCGSFGRKIRFRIKFGSCVLCEFNSNSSIVIAPLSYPTHRNLYPQVMKCDIYEKIQDI